uniref:Uncharacterized protein n=1 Tax=Rhodococcus hoagii TaxID=43767 RepID=A0A1Z1UYU7_RHOHA|nr:hypothetical protein [Prescottella equi]ARX60175.1 hypothetical protein pVAPN1572_1391 [Prescottella equi]
MVSGWSIQRIPECLRTRSVNADAGLGGANYESRTAVPGRKSKEVAIDTRVHASVHVLEVNLLEHARACLIPHLDMRAQPARRQFTRRMFEVPFDQSACDFRRETLAPKVPVQGIRQLTTRLDLTEPSAADHVAIEVLHTPFGPAPCALLVEVAVES